LKSQIIPALIQIPVFEGDPVFKTKGRINKTEKIMRKLKSQLRISQMIAVDDFF